MSPALWGGSRAERSPGGLPPPMTNRLALVLGGLVLGLLILDLGILHTGATLFLGRKFADLVEYLSFWR